MFDLLVRYSSELVRGLLWVLGSWLVFRITNRRADLVYYNSAPWKLPFNPSPLPYYGGVLMVGNQGGAPASEVRVIYPAHLLNNTTFEITSPWPYTTEGMPNGDRAFILESLPPKHWVNISYVTTLFIASPSYVGHEQGGARQVNFQWQRVYPAWFNYSAAVLFVLGAYSAVVLLIRLVAYLARHG